MLEGHLVHAVPEKSTTSTLLGLSNELLHLILEQIEPDPDKTIPIDRRQFLSCESFNKPKSTTRGSLKDIGNFRSACRRFADVGAPLLFTLVDVRFSTKGLDSLEKLAGWPHLARHVKRFTLLMPYFYRHAGMLQWHSDISSADNAQMVETMGVYCTP